MRIFRTLGSLLGIAMLLMTASTARAHSHYDSSTPAAGESLSAPPTAVTIWYTEGIQAEDSWIHVLDSNGTRVDMNDNTVIGDDNDGMTVSLRPGLAQGLYTVSWQNVSEDGDGLTGSFQFGVGVAPAASGASEMDDDHDDDHDDHH